MIKKVSRFFQRLSIFNKILISFILVIVIPAVISLIISGRITEGLIVNQAKKDASNNVDIVTISVSNVFNELKNASLYISNNESVMEYLTLLNKDKEQLSGNDMISLMDLLRKVEATCNSVYYTKAIDMDFTLLSTTGKIAYSKYNVSDHSVKDYLQRYSSEYISSIGSTYTSVGIEKGMGSDNSTSSPYVLTWMKTIESKQDTNVQGVLIVSISIDEIARLIKAESPTSNRILLDENMNVTVSAQQDWLNQPFEELFHSEVRENGRITASGSDNKQYLLTYKELNKEGWQVVDIKPLSELSEGLRSVSQNLLLLNLIYIFIFILVSIALARNISVPLSKLSKAMEETDLRVRDMDIDVSTKNEVSILEQNFDQMRANIQRLMQENIEKEKKKRDAEQKALYAQINPHFLFNTLNAVRCAIDTDKKQKASEVIIALMNLLRMALKGEPMIPLSQEMDNLKYYVQILQMRHGFTFSAEFELPDILTDYKVPKLLLQPILENSIIHGFEGLEREGQILVTAELEPDNVVIRIFDNGKGMEVDPLSMIKIRGDKKFSSIGIKNVDQRIKAHYGDVYGIQYKSIPGESTTAIITLPVFSDGEDGK